MVDRPYNQTKPIQNNKNEMKKKTFGKIYYDSASPQKFRQF